MEAFWVPWLHMHQPLVWLDDKLESNLKKMILSQDSKESWDGKLIARAYKNPAKYIERLSKFNPKIVLDFSGILLESLDKLSEFLKDVEVEGEKIGNIIESYKNVLRKFPDSIEFAGSAYSHCYFPVTPERDWKWQIREWQNVFSSLFGKNHLKKVKGFWLPEMGTPSYGDKLSRLIKILKDFGYEWIILPIFSVNDYEKISYEDRVRIFSKPNKISINDQEITTLFSTPYYFLDQQAGMDASYVYEQCLKAKKILNLEKPALIITASDGENGNVMMNQFFPETYTTFFTKFKDQSVSSILVSEFLEKYYRGEKLEKVELKLIGASWVGGHERWIWGEKRASIAKKIDELSEKVNEVGDEDLLKLLLIAETSCYVYWGTDYWFSQGGRILDVIEKKLKNFSKNF
ncbi:MAG: hypothetical protein N3D78_00580 [Candidatus Aenigmarchaeota archaeon]|nr:hypothetical protein [Candidatus Aenigmarchaeota archaeon]